MIRFVYILLLTSWLNILFGQEPPLPPPPVPEPSPWYPEEQTEDPIYDFVDEDPQFPGGMDSLMNYLRINTKYPEGDICIQGKVYLKFVIEKDGSVTHVEVMKGVHPKLDQEAIDVVRSMPNWIPGKQNGKIVRCKYALPIRFMME